MTKIEISKQRSFTNDYDNNSLSLVRVFNKNLKPLGGRHSWVKLTAGTKCIYRTIKAGKSSPGFSSNAIELDYDSLRELDLVASNRTSDDEGFYPCNLTISPTNILDVFKAYWNHPEQGYRISLRISMVSLLLGVLGLVI
jgi:hypothetical protein